MQDGNARDSKTSAAAIQRTLAAKLVGGDGRVVLPPVLQRELLVRARRGSTPWIRLGIYLMALMLVALLTIPAMMMGSITGGGMGGGRVVFEPLRYLLLVYALFEGSRCVAAAIPDERRDGTLGFLFLTNLRSWEVLLGKTAGGALSAFYGAMVVAPLFVIPLLLGGVTGGEVFRSLVTLFSGLLLAIGCGTVASAFCLTTLPAILLGLGLTALLSTGPLILGTLVAFAVGGGSETHWSGWLSPFTSTLLGNDAAYYRSPEPFWWSILLQLSTAVLLALLASWRLAANWRDGSVLAAPREPKLRITAAAAPTTRLRREEALPKWLSGMGTTPLARTLGGRINLRRWIVVLVGLQLLITVPAFIAMFVGGTSGAMIAGILQIPLFFAGLASQLILIYTACRIFSDARHTGEMEILLTSPVTDRELVTTLWHLLRNGLVWVFGVMVLGAVVGFLGRETSPAFAGAQTEPVWASVLTLVFTLASEALHLVGIVWAAMWFGVKTTRTSGAMIKTFVLVVVVTGLVKWLIFFCIQIPLLFGGVVTRGTPPSWLMSMMVAYPAVIGGILSFLWYLWARKRLFTQFRQIVTETETRSLWIDRLETRLVPPPLPASIAFASVSPKRPD